MTAEQCEMTFETTHPEEITGKTQVKDVLRYMHENGSITQLEALSELGVFRLASRVNDLRNLGHRIKTNQESFTTRYNRRGSFARYTFED